jgi:hypothetical protein
MFRFTIRDLLWLMVVVGLALSLWLGWSRDVAKLKKESEKEIAAERDQSKKKMSGLAEAYRKAMIKSKLQEAALERYGVKADVDPFRIVPITAPK